LKSKISSYWIFYHSKIELIKLWMVYVVGKEWRLLSRSLMDVVVQRMIVALSNCLNDS
jgi:hypothetical protein